jgi:hypothetical protein
MAVIGTTLFVDNALDGQIKRFDLTSSPPAEVSALMVDRQLFSLVAAGGSLWGAECLYGSTVERIDAATGAETPQDLSGLDISNCPAFADNPALPKVFYIWSEQHTSLYRIDVTSGSMNATASWHGSVNDVTVAPDGSALIVGTPSGAVVLDPTSMIPTGVVYRDGANVQAVAISPDGHVAVGVANHVDVFPSGGSTPNASWTLGACLRGMLDARGLSFGPTPSTLFASSNYGLNVSVLSHATTALASSTIVVGTEPPNPTPGDTVTISGSVTVPGDSASGRSIAIYDVDDYSNTESFVGTAKTDAGGAYSLDVPGVSAGTHCFDARFVGTPSVTGANAGATVAVNKVPSALTISGPASNPVPGSSIVLTGSLTFDDATPAGGATVHIEHTINNGDRLPAGDATVQPDGSWTFSETADVEGTYSYRATFDGTSRYASDMVTTDVLVTRFASSLHLAASSTHVTYGDTITLKARLHVSDIAFDRTVRFYMDARGKPPVLIGTDQASSNGVAALKVRPPGGVTFEAVYNGDKRDLDASDAVKVTTRWWIGTRLKRAYGVSGPYHLYHQGVVPLYVVYVAPAAVTSVAIKLQRLHGSWHRVAIAGFNTSKKGVLGVLIDPHIFKLGVRYRLSARVTTAFTHGYTLSANGSSYSYLRVTR